MANVCEPKLTELGLSLMSMRVIDEGARISARVRDNWFPCGFANLHIDGRSPILKILKKYPVGEGSCRRYEYAMFSASKDDYAGGYVLRFRYPSRTATEDQSLNFLTPLYEFIQSELVKYGVKAELCTRVD